jgi:hypothetical protein
MDLKAKNNFNREINEGLWSSSSMFATAVDKVLGSLNLIEALMQIGNPQFKVITANRRRLGRSVIARTMEMASALACYASRVQDQILSAKVSLSPAMMARSWDPVISATARSIYDLCEELIETGTQEAAQCGITSERNQLLLNAIVAFSAAIGSGIGTSGPQPVSVDAECKRAQEILKGGIDPLMVAVKAQSESFFASYRQARELAEALPQMLLNL